MLEVNLSEFDDFEIEYNKLEESDFQGLEVEKIIIEPNSKGYISEAVEENLILENRNTVAINCAVGQGKSTSIVRTIEKLYEETDDYLIFVASPFVTLVNQYYQDIAESNVIDSDTLYHYKNIRTDYENSIYTSKRIHVITTNLLLNNPGEDSFFMNERKELYIQRMIDKAQENNLKVVVIYDEIHDTIHNFKQELIFNLFRWKDVLHKNIILSATFNESSKVVLGYLAELTDRKLKILESERIRKWDQSNLYLHFDDNSYGMDMSSNKTIRSILDSVQVSERNLDVLCCYRKIAKNLKDGLLKDRYGEESIRLCVSGIDDNSRGVNDDEIDANRYSKNHINVGTNFKTGVSIHKENHVFVIILPPKHKGYKKYKGIFSDGVLSIVQAFARQRRKGEIHVILPYPKPIDLDTVPFDLSSKNMFEYYLERVNNEIENAPKCKYLPMSSMKVKLEEFYRNKKSIFNRLNLNLVERGGLGLQELNFPNYESVVLDEGEKYLSSELDFYGKDLSTVILYNAITNQYVNCKLSKINLENKWYLDYENLDYEIYNLFYEELYNYKLVFTGIGIDNYQFNIFHLYNNFKERYVYFNKNTGNKLTNLQLSKFNTALLSFASQVTGENILSKMLIGNLKFHLENNSDYHIYVNEFRGIEAETFFEKLKLLFEYFKTKIIVDVIGNQYFEMKLPLGFYDLSIQEDLQYLKQHTSNIIGDYFVYSSADFEKKMYQFVLKNFFTTQEFDNRHIQGVTRKTVLKIVDVLY